MLEACASQISQSNHRNAVCICAKCFIMHFAALRQHRPMGEVCLHQIAISTCRSHARALPAQAGLQSWFRLVSAPVFILFVTLCNAWVSAGVFASLRELNMLYKLQPIGVHCSACLRICMHMYACRHINMFS
jgi:hypothetical protein